MPTPLERVTEYAATLARLTSQVDAVRASRDDAIRDAHAQGTPVTVLAEAAGVSRVSIYAVLGQES